LSTTQLDEIKRKYNLENENEFKLLQDSMSEQQQQQQQQQEHQTTIISDNKPTIDRNLKPRIENSYNFRTIIIPKDLTSKFLDLAFANTSRNIETCGILAGKLVNINIKLYFNSFIIIVYFISFF
jgi:STAM-binding protein